MTNSVHIVAVGARTPLGLTAKASAAAARARISRIQEHPHMIDMRGEPVRCARDELIDPLTLKRERVLQLANPALSQVVRKLAESLGRLPGNVPLLVGVGEARFGWDNQRILEFGRLLAEDPGVAGLGLQPALLPIGHAAAFEGLRSAWQGLLSRQYELCILGGVDSNVDADSLLWIDGNGRLAADGVRAGFAPGEAAAFLALASAELVAHARLTPLATLRGLGVATEQRGRLSGAPATGQGLSAAIAEACAGLAEDELVDQTFCDINGERHRTEEWGFALLRNQGKFRSNDYVTAVGEWGDVGAASSPLAMVLAVQAFQRGYARGRLSLVWASSDSGLRGAAVLERTG